MVLKVFYYQTERGNSPTEDFLDSLHRKAKAKSLAYMDMQEDFGLNVLRPIAAKVQGDILELRPDWGGTEYRFLYFIMVGERIMILHALTKIHKN